MNMKEKIITILENNGVINDSHEIIATEITQAVIEYLKENEVDRTEVRHTYVHEIIIKLCKENC